MAATMPTTAFCLCTSATELAHCPDDDDLFIPNAELAKVLEVMHIKLNLAELHDDYFDNISVCTGDVLVFTSSLFTQSYFIINLYKGRTDQLDCVNFYFTTPHQEVIEQIKPLLRCFYDQAEYQIAYEEYSVSSVVRDILDCQLGEVWRVIEESDYLQKIIYHSGNFVR